MKPKMTPEEAIKVLQSSYHLDCKVTEAIAELEARVVAVEALGKQIPKKIEKQQWIDTICECGRVFSKHHGDGYHSIPYENQTKYCPECGQALDWEEGGEE